MADSISTQAAAMEFTKEKLAELSRAMHAGSLGVKVAEYINSLTLGNGDPAALLKAVATLSAFEGVQGPVGAEAFDLRSLRPKVPFQVEEVGNLSANVLHPDVVTEQTSQAFQKAHEEAKEPDIVQS